MLTFSASHALPVRRGTRERGGMARTADPNRPKGCVINTVLVTNPKHSVVWSSIKKANSMPARFRTSYHQVGVKKNSKLEN